MPRHTRKQTGTALAAAFLYFAAPSLLAQPPFIVYRGVVNAASFMPAGLPGGAIAQGSIFTIFGSHLGPASSPSLSYPLQTTLGGVSLTVSNSSITVNAIPIYVSPSQINAVMPSNAPLGLDSVQVHFNGALSNPAPIQVTTTSFGIFSATGSGIGPGVLMNYVSPNVQPVNSLSQPAKPDQVLTLWGTGLGPVTFPDDTAPTAGNLPTQTEVFVAGQPANILYHGRSPCCSGVDQIVLQLPANSPTGCWVPVSVRTAGAVVSNFVTIAVNPSGAACSDSANPVGAAFAQGGNLGVLLAGRVAVHDDVAVLQPIDTTTDLASAWFGQQQHLPFSFNPLFSLPPAGACTGYASPVSGNLPGVAPSTPLTPGAVTLAGAAGSQSLYPLATPGTLSSVVGSALLTLSDLFLNPGSFTFSGAVSAAVAAFQAAFNLPQPLTWTNRDQITSLVRSAGLTLNWTGAASNQSVFVYGFGADLPSNSSYTFVCRANLGDATLTVPPAVLANLPPTRPLLTQSLAAVYVGQWPIANPVLFSASGLDFGGALAASVQGKTVVIQ